MRKPEPLKVKVESVPMGGPGGRRLEYRGVWVPEGARLIATGDGLPGRITYTLGIVEDPVPRLVITELAIAQRPGRRVVGIQTTGLRNVKVPELIAAGVEAIFRTNPRHFGLPPEGADLPAAMWRHQTKRRGHGRIYSDAKLAQVAAIYRANPGRGYVAVAQKLNIPRSTAGDYIQRAKDAGLLTIEAKKGGKR